MSADRVHPIVYGDDEGMGHHVEVFLEDGTRRWGWQCFEPSCKATLSGLLSFTEAEAAANRHAESKREVAS